MTDILEIYSSTDYETLGEEGGTIINMNPDQVLSWINGVQGGLDPLSVGWGINIMHEIYHTKFGFSIGHEEEIFGDVGNVESQANKIRNQLGLPERMSYGPLKINFENQKTIRLIPFDKESLSTMNDLLEKYGNGIAIELKELEKIKGKFIKY
jgi:hypothetical protein